MPSLAQATTTFDEAELVRTGGPSSPPSPSMALAAKKEPPEIWAVVYGSSSPLPSLARAKKSRRRFFFSLTFTLP